jgi:NAD(P)H dehydrogenase (quinone)
MKYLIIYAHPNPASFNHAIMETISEELKKSNKDFEIRDLYKVGFNPVLSTEDLAALQDGAVPHDIKQSRTISILHIPLFLYLRFGGHQCRQY